jgi:hypothetical protein
MFMDRIYTTHDSDLNLFKEFALNQILAARYGS